MAINVDLWFANEESPSNRLDAHLQEAILKRLSAMSRRLLDAQEVGEKVSATEIICGRQSSY